MSALKPTRRKKAPVVPIEVPQEAAPEPVAAPLRVSLSDLWEMRLAQADKRTAEAQLEAAKFSRMYALAKLDPKGIVLGIEKKLDSAKRDAEAAENRALIAKKRMEHTLGRPMTGLAIDPDSGEVQIP